MYPPTTLSSFNATNPEMEDDEDLVLELDQIDAIVEHSPFGELATIVSKALCYQEQGTLIARVSISALNELAGRWLARGLTANFYSFIFALSDKIPQLVELDDTHICVFSIDQENMEEIGDEVHAAMMRYFIYDIEDEIHELNASGLRKMLEELATLLGDSVNPYLLEPTTIN